MNIKTVAFCTLIGCSLQAPSERVSIPANDLGVVTVEVDRSDNGGQHVFELRGLDARDHETALVRLQLDEHGSDLAFSFTGHTPLHITSSELEFFHVPPIQDAAIRRFLALDEVAALLRGEHIVTVGEAGREIGYQVPPLSYNCAANQVNTSPVAQQCCYTPPQWTQNEGYYQGWTFHVLNATFSPPGQSAMFRWKSDWGACKSSTGGTCGGSACYYGPNGYGRALNLDGTQVGLEKIRTIDTRPTGGGAGCQFFHDTDPVEFPNLSGSFPRNAGCCGNGSGPCDAPNAPACSTCGGGSGKGQWDY